jgi:hypothetical protein
MFIVTSTDETYKGTIGVDCVIRANTIGHEIHITRPIVLFLKNNGLISDLDTIVTKDSERFFFYSKIFKNIIDFKSLPKSGDIIYATDLNSLHEEKNNTSFITDIEKRFNILLKLRFKTISWVTDLIANFDYLPLSFNKPFIIIHHRITHYFTDINKNLELTKQIIENNQNYPIYIFCIERLPIENVKFIHNLQVYASMLNHPMCKYFISEFSGAGQLSQYCHNNKIIYYQNNYSFHNNPNQIKADMYDNFDYKKITTADVIYS